MLTKTQKKALSKMTHKQRIMWWFVNVKPEINPLESWQNLGIYRLQARISELKHKDGYDIETLTGNFNNQFGEHCKVANYSFKGLA
jgi:hypothetical protein